MNKELFFDKSLKVNPNEFGAVDALGRELPTKSEKTERKRTVGLFYWTWHTCQSGHGTREPINVTEVSKKHPEAINDYNSPVWKEKPNGYPHFWGEPIYGYYDDDDEFVVRKNAELIANAGVDVLFFDCTNGDALWDNEYKFLAKVYLKAIAQGVNVAKISFMLNFGPCNSTRTMLRKIYTEFYSIKENEPLFFYWEGKPMVMAHPECLDENDELDKKILEFFTFRHNEPTYFANDTSYDDEKKWWGWCSVYPQTKFGIKKDGTVEQMTVNVAQNANDSGLHAMNSNGGVGVYGRSYTKGDYSYKYSKDGKEVIVDKNIDNSSLYGLNFQQQWDYALSVDPEFIFITGWNELIAGRWENWEGTDNAFPDQFDYERSRDIEPTKTILGDSYYYQLCANIRRYKGVVSKEMKLCEVNCDLLSDITKWKDIDTEFAGYVGSGLGRDHAGWKDCYYKEEKTKNAVVLSKVAKSDKKTYFMCECEEDIKENDIILLIRTNEANTTNSWNGFDLLVRCNGNKGTFEKFDGKKWNVLENAEIKIADNTLVICVPCELNNFGFKWISGISTDNDFLDVYQRGSAVPAGRFYYRVK